MIKIWGFGDIVLAPLLTSLWGSSKFLTSLDLSSLIGEKLRL